MNKGAKKTVSCDDGGRKPKDFFLTSLKPKCKRVCLYFGKMAPFKVC